VDGQVTWTDDCAYPGQDLDGTPSRNIIKKEDCGNICLGNSRCDHFTWNTDKTCWLKNKWTGRSGKKDKVGSRCGYITSRSWTADGWTVDGDVTWKDNCDFKGQDLQETTNPALKNSIQECGKACNDHTQCDHFTWTPVDKKCNMKIKWDRKNPTSPANAKCGYVNQYPSVTSWRSEVFHDQAGGGITVENGKQMIFDWAMACWFDGLYNPAKINSLSFPTCKMNCFNDKTCKNLMWTPDTANGKIGECAKYDGTKVKNNAVVPKIDKRDNVDGTACGFFEPRKLSIQSVIPTDTFNSVYNP